MEVRWPASRANRQRLRMIRSVGAEASTTVGGRCAERSRLTAQPGMLGGGIDGGNVRGDCESHGGAKRRRVRNRGGTSPYTRSALSVLVRRRRGEHTDGRERGLGRVFVRVTGAGVRSVTAFRRLLRVQQEGATDGLEAGFRRKGPGAHVDLHSRGGPCHRQEEEILREYSRPSPYQLSLRERRQNPGKTGESIPYSPNIGAVACLD